MLYDITIPLTADMLAWPGDPAVKSESFGSNIVVSRWTIGSHTGTHIDAPAHFGLPGTLDQLDVNAMLGRCRVIEITDEEIITAELLRKANIAGVERLLIKTDNSLNAHSSLTFAENFVALDASAAELIVESAIKLTGIDYLSIEPFNGDGTVHRTLLGAGMIILEGLLLTDICPGEYELVCAPLKLQGSDGAPARVWLRDY